MGLIVGYIISNPYTLDWSVFVDFNQKANNMSQKKVQEATIVSNTD